MKKAHALILIATSAISSCAVSTAALATILEQYSPQVISANPEVVTSWNALFTELNKPSLLSEFDKTQPMCTHPGCKNAQVYFDKNNQLAPIFHEGPRFAFDFVSAR